MVSNNNVSKNKRLAINMIAQMVVFATNIGISFFLTPYLIENVGSEAYGFVNLANSFVSYAQILTVALNSMASRFITIKIQKEEYSAANEFYSSVIIANLFISIILALPAVLVLFFLDKVVNVPLNLLNDVTLLWALIFLNFLISIIGNVFSIATYARNRLDLASLVTTESYIIKCIILLSMYVFLAPHAWYIGLASVLCTIYIIFRNIYYTKILLPFVKFNKNYFNFSRIKELMGSGVWNSISKLGSILTNGLDLLIVNIFVGATAMGAVAISKILPTYILSLFSTLANVFSPQLTIDYAHNKYAEIKQQLLSSIKILGMFACIPLSILYAYGDVFFRLWVPSQDAHLLQILAIISCMSYVLALPIEALWNIFTVTNRVKQSSLMVLIKSIFSILFTFLFLQFANTDFEKMMIVCGVSSMFDILLAIAFTPVYGAKCLGLKWYTFYPAMMKNVFVIILVTFISFGIKYYLNVNSWLSLVFAGCLTTVISLVLNYFILLSRVERKILLIKFRNL